MNEEAWRVCTNPRPMLEFLTDRTTLRKLRLFACACCRRLWPQLIHKESRRFVEVAEAFADGRATQQEFEATWEAADDLAQGIDLAGGGKGDAQLTQAVAALGLLDPTHSVELAAEALGQAAERDARPHGAQPTGQEHEGGRDAVIIEK